jgi:hypothetical protein
MQIGAGSLQYARICQSYLQYMPLKECAQVRTKPLPDFPLLIFSIVHALYKLCAIFSSMPNPILKFTCEFIVICFSSSDVLVAVYCRRSFSPYR